MVDHQCTADGNHVVPHAGADRFLSVLVYGWSSVSLSNDVCQAETCTHTVFHVTLSICAFEDVALALDIFCAVECIVECSF